MLSEPLLDVTLIAKEDAWCSLCLLSAARPEGRIGLISRLGWVEVGLSWAGYRLNVVYLSDHRKPTCLIDPLAGS